MKKLMQEPSGDQRGFSLTEVLVATAIFTVVILGALLMYDRSNRVFKTSMEAANQQQNTRVAFDKLVSDLRMAGFDFDRDGIPTGTGGGTWRANIAYSVGDIVVPTVSNGKSYKCIDGGTSGPSEPNWSSVPINDGVPLGSVKWEETGSVNQYQQPDEQIEFAGRSAITIRGNIDYETDPANGNGREGAGRDNGKTTLESPQFPVVTTGNDEIVTYALESADPTKNTSEIVFYADVDNPRDAYPGKEPENKVTIGGVDLTNNNPPYTLVRITLNDDKTLNRVPLANNIRRVEFTYFEDTTGTTVLRNLAIPPVTIPDGGAIGGDGQYDPNAATTLIADRNIRAKIRSVGVRLSGMNEQPDMEYVDPDETVASATNFRKYELESLIVPRNAGKRGLREQDLNAPGRPKIVSVCAGYCGYAYLRWSAPLSGGAIDNYVIKYDTSPTGSFSANVPMQQFTEGAVPLDSNKSYFFKVTAINSYGSEDSNVFPETSPGISAKNAQKPPAADGVVTASTTVPNKVELSWKMSSTQTGGAISCSPGGTTAPTTPPAQEIVGYNVFRGNTATFVASTANRIASYNSANRPVLNLATGEVTFADTTAANCKPYYYRVQAVERCGFAGNDDWNVGNNLSLGYSDYSDPVQGQAATSNLAPAAPLDLTIANPSCIGDPSGGTRCTVILSWPTVRKDTASPAAAIAVDEYRIVRTQSINSTVVATNVFTTTGHAEPGKIALEYQTFTQDVDMIAGTGDSYTYRYTVQAVSCGMNSNPTPQRIFPCPFSAGTPTVTVTGAIDGNGSAAAPWLVDPPETITLTTSVNVASVRALVYSSGVLIDDQTINGPRSSFSYAIPEGVEEDIRYDFLVVDSNGCVLGLSRYVTPSSSSCCIRAATDRADASVVKWLPGNSSVEFKVENMCADPLPIQAGGIMIKWNPLAFSQQGQNPRVDRVTYTLSTGPSSFEDLRNRISTNSPLLLDPKSPVTAIPAGATMTVRVDFSKVSGGSFSPVTGFCIKYRRAGAPSPDGLSGFTCQFYPQPPAVEGACE